MFSLPETFVTDITSNATSAISALTPFVTLILGVLLSVVVVSVLIKTLTGHK